jgi:hypothetical protein
MKTKDRIAQVRNSSVPEIQVFIKELDKATTRKDIYILQNKIYDIPGIREMNHGDAWETFGYTLSDMCNAKERELNKIYKATKAAERATVKQEKVEAGQRMVARANSYMELPALKDTLDQASIGFYNNIVKWVTENLIRDLSYIYDTNGKFILQQTGKTKADHARHQYLLQLSYTYRESLSNRRADWKKVIEYYANKTAQDTIDGFKYKMALKLGAVIDKKGGAEIKVIGSTVDNNSLWFKFPDGSSFEIRTQQVISISVLGKVFARYPSTFYSVVDHTGQVMHNPSSIKMQTEFAGFK